MGDSVKYHDNNLGRIRLRLELSQGEAAELCGISTRSFQRWENGVALPPVVTAYRVADALGVRVTSIWPHPDPAGEAA